MAGARKKVFEKGRLSHVARMMVEQKQPGYLRLQYSLQQGCKLPKSTDLASAVEKFSRDEDIVHCVRGVMAAVAAKISVSVFQGVYFQNYTSVINPKHKPPHALKINRIIEVLIDGAVLAFTRIVEEECKKLCFGFISLTTNFVTDPNHHQSFGVVLLNFVAQKYKLVDGQDLFMSKETADRISDKLQSVSFCFRHHSCKQECSNVVLTDTTFTGIRNKGFA